MKYFLDFEFIEQGNQDRIWPISIGLVCEDGREYYAEWFDIPWFLANEWVLENVKPNLTYMEEQRKTGSLIRSELEDFIGDDRRPEFWGWYCDYDWVLFCGIWGTMMDLPEYFPRYCRDVKQLCDDLGNPPLPEQEGDQHHALHDTLWIVRAYKFLWLYALDHSVVAQAALQRACEDLLGAIGEESELKDKPSPVWRELLSRVRALQSEHEQQTQAMAQQKPSGVHLGKGILDRHEG